MNKRHVKKSFPDYAESKHLYYQDAVGLNSVILIYSEVISSSISISAANDPDL